MSLLTRTLSGLAVAAALSSQALAAPVVWGVNATFTDGSVLTGTAAFDDAPVAGFFDGYNDPNDTHIFGSTWTLSFAPLGWVNQVFTNVVFQPYFYSSYGDGPHVDSGLDGHIALFDAHGAYYYDANFTTFTSGTWSFNRNQNAVPLPATLSLVGLGLVALGASRRKQQQ